MKFLPWLGMTALVAGAAVSVPAIGSAAEPADLPPSLVEDFAYPGAEQVLAQHGLKLFKGDGNILFVTSRTYDQGQCATGELQVEKSLDAEPYGVYYCFKTSGSHGYLTLEVPGTFGVRGGDKPVEATANLPEGEKTYAVPANGFVAIDPGTGDEMPRAVLVELRLTGAAQAGDGQPAGDGPYGFVAKVQVGDGDTARSCSGALVAPQWVITTRSCLIPADQPVTPGAPPTATTVTVGRSDVASAGGHTTRATYLVPHPDRDLVLARLLTRAIGVTPVTVGATAPATGDVLRVAGYGRTGTEWVPDRPHAGSFAVTGVGATTLDITGSGAGATICKGDAGGPALRETPTGFELVALHHRAWQGGCLGETGTRRDAVETRVDDLGNWIRQHTPSACNALGSSRSADAGMTLGQLGDVNGDCRTDIIGQNSAGLLRAWASTGDLSGDGKLFAGAGVTVGGGWTTTALPRVLTGDFTGDGRTDIIGQNSAGQLRAWASTGDLSGDHKLFATTQSAIVGGGWTSTAVQRILTGDVDGDGKTDIIAQYNTGQLRAWASTGDLSGDHKLFVGTRSALVGSGWGVDAMPRIL